MRSKKSNEVLVSIVDLTAEEVHQVAGGAGLTVVAQPGVLVRPILPGTTIRPVLPGAGLPVLPGRSPVWQNEPGHTTMCCW